MEASDKEAMGKVILVYECSSESEAKVLGLEILSATGLTPLIIKSKKKVTNWNTPMIVKEIKGDKV